MTIRIKIEIEGNAFDGNAYLDFIRDGEPQGLTYENYRDFNRAPDRFFFVLPILTQQEFNSKSWMEIWDMAEKSVAVSTGRQEDAGLH